MPQQLRLFEAPEPPRAPGEVWVARGARAAEGLLFSWVDALLAEARKNPALLGRPVRILVPSRSLRAHLGAELVRRRGRSIAGVTIQTLHALACEILERAGEPVPRGTPLFDVLAQRLARLEPALRRGLDDLVDGYGAVAGTVRDLLDAGLELDLAEAVDEALATDGPRTAPRAEVDRARALVRVAARTEALAPALGLGRASNLLRRAAELFAADPESSLPSRALLIHGFSDATGVGTDFLQELLRQGARLILDHPPAPGSPGGVERAFTDRFTERLAMVSRFVPAPPPRSTDPPAPLVDTVEAVGAEAEAREAVRRVRALLDEGVQPERIGMVARDLAPYALVLRRHFRRLAVPFSGLAAHGALEPAGRRARAFLELLRRGEEVPADRWLDTVAALGRRSMAGLLVDLRLAFYALGAGRLRDVAELDPETFLKKHESGESYALPIRQGLRSAAAAAGEGQEGEEGETYAARRRVDGAQLRAAVRTAVRVCERLAAWPAEAPAAEQFRRLRALLVGDLGWDLEAADTGAVLAALAELEREVPGDFPLTRDELRPLVVRACGEVGVAPLGGEGGGVQVLTVTEARGRTFDHLFVIGLNRDVFPRGIREDPLLPDDLRQVLRRVLPDIPIKRAGFDEERYLFAWLLSASPSVTLCWQIADDDGRPRSPSPLLRGPREPRRAPSLWTPAAGGLRPADEHAVISALQGARERFGRVLAVALAEARAELLPGAPEAGGLALDPRELASARIAVLDEMDPDLRLPAGRAVRLGLGPYFGFAGPPAARRMDLHVTHLETLAGCPWQLFLGRVLQLEPTPDPLAALPGADPLLLGNVVHAVLERIVREAGSGLGAPAAVAWPEDGRFEQILGEEAGRLLALEGVLLPGLARALAERARPLLAEARAMDWPNGTTVPVLHAEWKEEVEVRDAAGQPRRLRFRADRIDRLPEGLRYTDYKTGRPLSTARKPEVRRRHFLERLRQGTLLQSTAYLLAARGEPAAGRYLYLKPGLDDPESREHAVTTDDPEAAEAFGTAVSATLAAWDEGAFFPRVVDPAGRNEPARCGYCAVAEACLRGDSGARLRLFEWAERARRADLHPAGRVQSDRSDGSDRSVGSDPARGMGESALLRVWRLAAKEEREAPENGNGNGGEEAP